MKRAGQDGVTLVELMVALVIGSLAVLVIQQVMAVFEAQKRTSSGGSDAQVNGAVALFSIEREIRQAGYGLFNGSGSLCPLGINIYYNGTTVSDGGTLRPVVIVDGGAGPDAIEFLRSSADFAAIPTSIVKNMPNASSIITVDSSAGLAQSQLFLAVGKDGGKVCTLMQMSQDPQKTGNGWNLQHNSGQYLYNPPNPNSVFTAAPTYEIGDAIVNMGNFVHGRYQVLCDRLTEVDPTTTAAPHTCANVTPLVDEIVDLQAQYGIAAAGSMQVSQWCDATPTSTCGNWANPGAADVPRIRAVRVAVVARSAQYEKEQVSPASLALWEAGDPGDPPPSRALTSDERHYRYKVFTTIVPIRNVIWGS
ncbi:MAG: PilW family protein [Burkholderiales bacterium]|nr:PilW family protein [Burkholderiales bacterium]